MLLATEVLGVHGPVAVAAATLAAAALFTPLRRRVQRAVDRRFNRAHYDADQTVAAFAARLKDAVDLDAVRDDLATVVHRTLEPVHVSVWLTSRDQGAPRSLSWVVTARRRAVTTHDVGLAEGLSDRRGGHRSGRWLRRASR